MDFSNLFEGMYSPCPTISGEKKPYIYLDSGNFPRITCPRLTGSHTPVGASTPSMKCVKQLLDQYIPYYSSVHRGNGFKSLLSTHLYEKTRESVLEFVNADPKDHVCIFTRNTTESMNRLARRFPFTSERFVVITTCMLPFKHFITLSHFIKAGEHHASDLVITVRLSFRINQLALASLCTENRPR